MVLKDKPHIFKRNGYWYVDMCFDWRYRRGCAPHNSFEECYTLVNNYHKGIHQRHLMIPQHLIDAAEALHEPKQTTWSELIPYKQVWQQVHGIWTRFK